ncbi:flagellar export protein FliJ [Anaerospora hongkongensis]|uniref:flagellar export protein FliJ n=1 Tax=Anaerospora hongkongensis TaxID=244830 RepID=UPI0028999FF7|nr:flagellar export protein FliJ [Anaerospora hongkongensis]
MKQFKFQLETLLRMRRLQQEEAQMRLVQATSRYQTELTALERLENEQKMQLAQFRAEQSKRQTIDTLKNYYFYFDKLNVSITVQQEQVEAADQQRCHCLTELAAATTKLKLVEKLKEKRLAEYKAEMLQQDQKLLDELGMQVFMRNRQV